MKRREYSRRFYFSRAACTLSRACRGNVAFHSGSFSIQSFSTEAILSYFYAQTTDNLELFDGKGNSGARTGNLSTKTEIIAG
jgi:hypothetical protein